jgi:hypothetical protein
MLGQQLLLAVDVRLDGMMPPDDRTVDDIRDPHVVISSFLSLWAHYEFSGRVDLLGLAFLLVLQPQLLLWKPPAGSAMWQRQAASRFT